jgi:hypothetical protein
LKRILLLSALVAAILVPSALAADPTPTDFKNAAKYCKALRESKGVEAFATLYGTNTNKKNAYGKCVSKSASARAEKREDAAEAQAVADCKKQKTEDAAKFAENYKNLGQCVKSKVSKNDDD